MGFMPGTVQGRQHETFHGFEFSERRPHDEEQRFEDSASNRITE